MFKSTPFSWPAPSTAVSNDIFRSSSVPIAPKPRMSASNFPQTPIACGEDLQARLRMSAGLSLNNELALTLRQQIVDHRNNASQGQGEMSAGGATFRATTGIKFGNSDLQALKTLRDFALKNGSPFSSPSTKTIFCTDFSALSIPISSSLFIQIASLENKTNETDVSAQIEGNRNSWLAEQHMDFCSEVMDWINGEKEKLSPETEIRLNALDAHHHHTNANLEINKYMLDAPASGGSMVWEDMTKSTPASSSNKKIYSPALDWHTALLNEARASIPQSGPSTSAASQSKLWLHPQSELQQLPAPWAQGQHTQKMKGPEMPPRNPFMPPSGASIWAEMAKTDPKSSRNKRLFPYEPARNQTLMEQVDQEKIRQQLLKRAAEIKPNDISG